MYRISDIRYDKIEKNKIKKVERTPRPGQNPNILGGKKSAEWSIRNNSVKYDAVPDIRGILEQDYNGSGGRAIEETSISRV